MKGFRLLCVPVLLLSLACTRETLEPRGETLSFACADIAVQERAETRSQGGSVHELVSEDGLSAFVLAEEMAPAAEIPTRASAYSAVSGISSFNVTAYDHTGSFGSSTLTYSNGKGFADETFTVTSSGSDYWGVPSTTRFWPVSDRYLSFFASAPANAVSVPHGQGYPSFTYSVPDDPALQQDLLVASTLDQAYTVTSQGTPGRAPLTFRHVLAAVVFSIGDMGVNSDAGSLTITLSGLRNQGQFLYSGASSSSSPGGSWTDRRGSSDISFTTNLHGTDTSPVEYSNLSGSNVLFLMPQAIPNDAVLAIRYTDPAGAVHRFSAALNTLGITTLTAGGLYKYTISLSNKPAALQVAYQQWTQSGSSTRVNGPVTSYVSGETFGVYAVDANNRVVFANAPMTASSSAATAALNSGNYFLSSTYTYYVYYPYKEDLNLVYQDGIVAAGRVLSGSQPNAFDFFADYSASFAPASSQNTLAKFKAADLQVGAASGHTGAVNVNMHHRMSLAKFVLQSANVPDIVYNGKANTTTRTNVSTRPGDSFRTDAPHVVPYHDGTSDNYYYIAKFDTKPWVAYDNSTEYLRWTQSTVVIQSASSTALGSGYIREFPVTSRAAARGFRTYVANYEYKGSVMTFTPPTNGTGIYRFQCWGAQGGSSAPYGRGGYVKGNMYVATGTTLYVYVGESGSDASGTTRTQTFNGGGRGKVENGQQRYRGGGATDVRTSNGDWNTEAGLRSRIFIAAGGGGSSHGGQGGNGGGLEGQAGVPIGSLSGGNNCGGGGTQTAGGAKGPLHDWGGEAPTDGALGIGGDGNSAYGGGGGGGLYGGGGAGVRSASMGGGGGGSSFISGYPGCSSVTHYVFTNSEMLSGGESQIQPDGSTQTGHSGHGYARITFIEP